MPIDTQTRVPGIFTNPKAGLLLKFQFNPMTMDRNKDTYYDIRPNPGLASPTAHWRAGGAYTLGFELFFDRTDSSRTPSPVGSGAAYINIGVLDVIAIIESFKLPEESWGIGSLGGVVNSIYSRSSLEFNDPPDCYFIYGSRWHKTKLISAPMRETMYNKSLVPERVSIPIELLVLEEGSLFRIEEAKRKSLAVLGSGISVVDIATDLGRILA